jgi:pimeloyl-ACP methyl ester carboxylesterase
MVDGSPLLVLVHSPLLGPSAWEWVARDLDQHGRMAVVPSLREAMARPEPSWRDAFEVVTVSAQGASSVTLVGHSGAGVLLPAIAESIAVDVTGIVFVDAFLPPANGTAPLVPHAYIDELNALAADGVLPPWSSWFGEELMRELVPDAARRSLVERDMPRLPLSSLRRAVPVPSGWDRRPCGYLLLSAEPYAPSAADAGARGWPVAEIEGGKHLDPVRRPATVTAALLNLEHAMADRS